MEKKRILSMLLPVAMLVTMIPVMTYAEEAGTDDGASAVSDVQEEQESVDIVSMYAAQDNLVAFFTVFKDGTVDIEKGTWTDLVGGGVATMGTPSRWFVNANGSVGYDIFYGQVDGNGNYTKDSSYNNYSVNGTRLDLGIAQLPKDDFTVEFGAQINPVYAADEYGKPAGETYLLNGSTPGSQQYGAAAYGAVYQMGYFAGYTTNRDGIHGGYTGRGAIFKGAIAIQTTHTANTKIIGNTVVRVPYSAFSIGWVWGTTSNSAADIVNGARFIVFNTEIAYNYISDFMMSMEDGGVDISDITAVIAIAAGSSAE